HEDVPGRRHRDAPRFVGLAGFGARRAELRDVFVLFVELLDAVFARVDHPQVAVRAHREFARAEELPFSGSGDAGLTGARADLVFGFAVAHAEAEGGNEFAFLGVLLDAVVGAVADVDRAGRRHGYALRFGELSRRTTGAGRT